MSAECVCQGPKDTFAYIGGMPRSIVFDNATGIGRRIGEAVSTSKPFGAFSAHYGFACRFCDPSAGNEKGAVENMVGAMRRSLSVPRPNFDNTEPCNARLFDRCSAYCDKPRCKHDKPRLQRFIQDRSALGDLPASGFKAIRHEKPKTGKKGRMRLFGRHRYSTSPALATRRVIAGIPAFRIEVYTGSGEHAVAHARAFGEAATDTSDPASQPALSCRKPGAWINPQARCSLSDDLRSYMDTLPEQDLKRPLATLRDVSAASGHRATAEAMAHVPASIGSLDGASVTVLATTIASGHSRIEYDGKVDLGGYGRLLFECGKEHP